MPEEQEQTLPGVVFSTKQRDAINAALAKQFAKPNATLCSFCAERNWVIQGNGLVYLSVQPIATRGIVLGGPTLPAVALMCQTCGNTLLLNVFGLGVAEAFGMAPTVAEKEPAEAKP
jgi:hypothetical protein